MTPPLTLEHEYARTLPQLSVRWQAPPRRDPQLVVLNTALAAHLGLDEDWLRSDAGAAALTGRLPDGGDTYAQAYAGHQFGGYSPLLGDGRAVLLGELVDSDGRRWDLHLKGAGRTPFARRGDGNAVLGPMLREYLVSEAMHALGIATTRSLAVVSTGEPVLRDGPQPGAVLTRVAASHLRVGTFQYAAAQGDPELLRRLADYVIARHHPAAGSPLGLFRAVVHAQAALVAGWMLVGFVHGVMNTDNMAVSGETIDYGPCAFMDAFDPSTVFSSIDHGGRYAWGNQPGVAHWNLARFAESLLPLLGPDPDTAAAAATEVLEEFQPAFERAWLTGLAGKLGLGEGPADPVLVRDLLTLLAVDRVDWTGFFRALASGTAGALFGDPAGFEAWNARRLALLPDDPARVAAAMNRVNPVYLPRNHLVEDALAAATAGDLGPFHTLLEAVRQPYDERPGLAGFDQPGDGTRYVTFCGT